MASGGHVYQKGRPKRSKCKIEESQRCNRFVTGKRLVRNNTELVDAPRTWTHDPTISLWLLILQNMHCIVHCLINSFARNRL
jgi:hypothetical protein